MLDFGPIKGMLEITGYLATNKDLVEFSERGKMNTYMEQAVMISDVEDKDRECVQEYMRTRGQDPKEVQLLQEFIPQAEVEAYNQSVAEVPKEDHFT